MSAEYLGLLRNGDIQKLRKALDAGMPVEARDEQGNTPLILATAYSDVASVKLLLDRGADVNAANKAGATALLRAARSYEMVRLLVDRGAEVNVRSALGNTPLILAARPADGERTVEFLLKHGADATATNNWGATALMAAAASGNEVSVRLLLKYGANPNAQPLPGPEAFLFAGGRNALMWSAFRGDTGAMKALLEAGADPNAESFLGTPTSQAAWADQIKATRLLLDRGAQVDQKGHGDSFTPLHWAASTEKSDARLVDLLVKRGANPNAEGGESIEAFMDVPQTPLMLAKRRGDTKIVSALTRRGATNETPDELKAIAASSRLVSAQTDEATIRAAISQAIAPLQETSIISKQAFVNHASRQDCTSCHQQHMPLAAVGAAKRSKASVDSELEQQLIEIVKQGDLKTFEPDWEALFHPDTVYTKGYTLFGYAGAELPADELTDAAVHHLASIQDTDGRWRGNLPRPPLQNGDVAATALAIHALQKYPLPGRKAELAERVERGRRWLWTVKPANTDERAFQLLGLAWAGESSRRLETLAKRLAAEQREDGGWSQLPTLASDAYATGQSVYALRVALGMNVMNPAIEKGQRYLLQTQLDDGTWYVRRRAFPFQPTMKSGFPHGKDSWISAAASSWAVLALSQPQENTNVTSGKPAKLASQTK
ncbi:MAG TPA: ankyrin repeat domain-containing protein [Verrucomicrobiae bacterium]|nr:ankyrin repeat domain-containing protein [Verrucomicrobiae bacterium]